jgi:phage shock protein E
MMNRILKYGLTVVVMGLLSAFLFGHRADRDADIAAMVGNGALVIDARTPREFRSGHVEGAINIPYDTVVEKIGDHAADRSREIVIYCHSGARSGAAKRALEKAGYTDVVNGGSLKRMRRHLGDG